jgi:hypothetical protein
MVNDFTPKNDIEKDLRALVRAQGHPKEGDGTLTTKEYSDYMAAIPQGALMLVDLGQGMTYVTFNDLDRMSNVETIDMETKVQVHKGYHKDKKDHRMTLSEIKKRLQQVGTPTDEEGNVLNLNSQRHYESIKGLTIMLSETQHQAGGVNTGEGGQSAEVTETGESAMVETVLNKLDEDLSLGMITQEEHDLYSKMAEDSLLILNGAGEYTFLQEPEDYQAQTVLGLDLSASAEIEVDENNAPVESGVLMGQNDPVVERDEETKRNTDELEDTNKEKNPNGLPQTANPQGDIPAVIAGAGSVQPTVPAQVDQGTPAKGEIPQTGVPKKLQIKGKKQTGAPQDVDVIAKSNQPLELKTPQSITTESTGEAKGNVEVNVDVSTSGSNDDAMERDWQRYQEAVQQSEQLRQEQFAQSQNQRYRDGRRRNRKDKGGLPVGKIAVGAGSLASLPFVGGVGLAGLLRSSSNSGAAEVSAHFWPLLDILPHLSVSPFWV